MTNIDMRIRKWIARIFPGRFPHLYSTLDNPMIVPLQEAAYRLGVDRYIRPGDKVLDVGFGLGYGLEIMGEKAGALVGIEIDRRAVERAQVLIDRLPVLQDIRQYDGVKIPFPQGDFDVITCVDVIEHVPDYQNLLREMVRVSRRIVIISTPNRRPEFSLSNGRPRNPWHLREWSYEEISKILGNISGVQVEWNFLDGPWEGPIRVSSAINEHTMAFAPALILETAVLSS